MIHIPRVANGPFIAACSCGWNLTGQPVEDGGEEWYDHSNGFGPRWQDVSFTTAKPDSWTRDDVNTVIRLLKEIEYSTRTRR